MSHQSALDGRNVIKASLTFGDKGTNGEQHFLMH